MLGETFARACLFIAAAAPAIALVSGCSPTTSYRYSAVVPAARPIEWDGRTARPGTLRVEGTLDGAQVGTKLFPQIHDTAVLVPQWTLDGAATLAVASHVEIGARVAYASYDWTTASAVGTMPVPGSPSSWGIGPELRFSLPLDRQHHFALGFAGNLMQFQTPYAEWQLDTQCAGATDGCYFGFDQNGNAVYYNYTLHDARSESHWLYSLGLYPSYAFGDHGEYGHAFALIGLTAGLGNDGFTNTPQNGSTIHGTNILQLGAGYGVSIEMLHLMAMLYKPMNDSDAEVSYGFGFQLSAGVNLDLWQPTGKADAASD